MLSQDTFKINDMIGILNELNDITRDMHSEDAQLSDDVLRYLACTPCPELMRRDLAYLKEIVGLIKKKITLVHYLNYLLKGLNEQDSLPLKTWLQEIKPQMEAAHAEN
jgi:hypothetical protein